MSRDEIIAAIQKCAEELGHVPTLDELLGKTTISKHKLRKNFGPYVKALAACGLERHGCGYKIGMENLFLYGTRSEEVGTSEKRKKQETQALLRASAVSVVKIGFHGSSYLHRNKKKQA